MDIRKELAIVLDDVLALGGRAGRFSDDTPLLGALPELDSMAVVGVIAGIEEHFGVYLADDEIDGSSFATFGSLVALVEEQAFPEPRQLMMPAGISPIFLSCRCSARIMHYTCSRPGLTMPGSDRFRLTTILWLQPFAEEANCARRHMVAAARECQRHGIGSLILDLSGSGESDGELADASLPDWLDEIQRAREWLAQRSAGPVWLGGLRAGALLAAQAASAVAVKGLVLWQPVLSGRALIDQFLRQQLAVDWAHGSAANAAQILTGLRETLARGEAVTIAGYTLSAGLAAELGALEISPTVLARSKVVLLESRSPGTGANDANGINGFSPGLEKFRTALHDAGADVTGASCEATPFWASHEAPVTPAVASTLADALVRAMPAADAVAPAAPALCASSPSGVHVRVLPVAEGVVATLHDGHAGRTASAARMGVIMLTGGMQIRAGSHRQYLQLARTLAAQGHAVLRVDFPGLGDSPGTPRHYAENADVISAAITELLASCADIDGIVLWGLCDGASAAALYACEDARISAVFMVNPWLDNVAGHAGLSGYYHRRLVSPAFWRSLLRGEVGVMRSAAGFVRHLWSRVFASRNESAPAAVDDIWSALGKLTGRVTVLTGEADRTGQAFLDMLACRPDLQKGVVRLSVPHADHTFSTPAWHAALVSHTLATMRCTAGDVK